MPSGWSCLDIHHSPMRHCPKTAVPEMLSTSMSSAVTMLGKGFCATLFRQGLQRALVQGQPVVIPVSIGVSAQVGHPVGDADDAYVGALAAFRIDNETVLADPRCCVYPQWSGINCSCVRLWQIGHRFASIRGHCTRYEGMIRQLEEVKRNSANTTVSSPGS